MPAVSRQLTEKVGFGAADGQFDGAYDAAVVASGAVYIADSEHNLVKVFAYTTDIEHTTWERLKTHFR